MFLVLVEYFLASFYLKITNHLIMKLDREEHQWSSF